MAVAKAAVSQEYADDAIAFANELVEAHQQDNDPADALALITLP